MKVQLVSVKGGPLNGKRKVMPAIIQFFIATCDGSPHHCLECHVYSRVGVTPSFEYSENMTEYYRDRYQKSLMAPFN